MTCLTVTPATADEAIRERAGLIVSHHPVLFRETKRIRADLAETGHLWTLARAGVAIASPHTAFDNTRDGINDLLCRSTGDRRDDAVAADRGGEGCDRGRLCSGGELVQGRRLHAGSGSRGGDGGGVRGRGRGDRRLPRVLVRDPRRGDVLRDRGDRPDRRAAGSARDRRRAAAGVRLPADRLAEVLAAIRARHSYEEPAIDVYPLHDSRAERGRPDIVGAGRIGRLERPVAAWPSSRRSSAARSAASPSRWSAIRERPIQRVAVSCGAGDDFLKDAARAGADVLLTGEARFHRGLEAEALGIAPDHRRPSRHRATRRRGPGAPHHRGLPRPRPSGPAGASETRSARSLSRWLIGTCPTAESTIPSMPSGAKKTPGATPGHSAVLVIGGRRSDARPQAQALLLRLGGRRLGFFLFDFDLLTLDRRPAWPGRAVGNGRNIWCSHCPDQNCPVHFCSEIVRTVGRSSSRITSPHAPVYAARTWEELSPTHSRRSPLGARHATARQS